jgi:prefoldin subunit 5
MILDVPPPEPSTVEAAPGTIDLAKERELRQLRAQVAALTSQVAELDVFKAASVLSVKQTDETHGRAACGFHTRVLVSMTESAVWCAVCNCEVEPMDVLREYAKKERNFIEALQWLRDEKAALRKEVDELKKIRSSLRSQVKRKAKTVADAIGEGGRPANPSGGS